MKARKLKQPLISKMAAAHEESRHRPDREAKAKAHLLATRAQFARALTIAESLEDRAHGVLAGPLQGKRPPRLDDARVGDVHPDPLQESD